MAKLPVSSSSAPRPAGPYSHGIAAGNLFFTSGFGPHDPATGAVVGTTVGGQTRQTLANVAAVLAERGLDLSDVVKATVHLQHLERDFAEFNEAYRGLVPEPFPVRTTVGSDLLGILVEIDVVALDRS
ncbi:RidA family protein [Dactylosporangium salmoneum]|uniref:RidA family protein n=1 Tax=Dactylosporangium salmoneum TaxID=53361 RepID=A0ABP5UU09_9ACTN